MLRVTVKGLLGHKVRFLLAALSITIGVAFLAGTMVYTATIRRTFDDMLADTNRHIDAAVRSTDSQPSPMGDTRARIDASLVDTIRAVPGVAGVSGGMAGYTQVVGKDGKPMGGFGPPTLGISWPQDPLLSTYTLTDGRPPGRGEIVLDRASVTNGRFAMGDRVRILTKVGPEEMTLVGAVRYGSADSPAGATLTFFDYATAERLVGEAGKVDDITVAAAEGVSRAEVRDRIAAVLPAGQPVEVITGDQLVQEVQDVVAAGMGFFSTFMLVFALIAVLVAAFIINNTFSILVAQRTGELALLRALGASRAQVVGSVGFEALVLGLVASFAGMLAGLGLAYGLKFLLSAVGFNMPTSGLAIPPSVVGWSVLLGVGITMVAALVPARRASRVAPMEALQHVHREPKATGPVRITSGLVLLAAGLLAIAVPLVRTPDDAIALVGIGAAITFVALMVLAPAFARPVARALGSPFARGRGEVGHLAQQNAMRNPRRTSATATALMIGVALVGTITILAASTKTSTDALLEQSLRADLMVVPTGGIVGGAATGIGFSPDVARALERLPEVEVASPVRASLVTVDGAVAPIVAVDGSTFPRVVDLGRVDGDLGALGPGTVALARQEADNRGLHLGDEVPIGFSTQQVESLRVVAIFERAQVVPGLVISLDTAAQHFMDDLDYEVAVKLRPGVDVAAGKAAVERVTAPYENIQLLDQSQFRAQQSAGVDQLLALVYALLFLSVIIALIGIANTLVLSIHERWHELGVLRALGMTQRQVRASIRYESVIIALFGTALGLGAGVLFGVAVTKALAGDGVSHLVVPVGQLAVIGVLASVAGMLASASPARRAARVQVLRAVASE